MVCLPSQLYPARHSRGHWVQDGHDPEGHVRRLRQARDSHQPVTTGPVHA